MHDDIERFALLLLYIFGHLFALYLDVENSAIT